MNSVLAAPGIDTACYYSPLAQEPDLAELVQMFVGDLPDRLAEIRRFAGFEDWSEVVRLAHQLKGAGGSYGFPHLSQAAAHLEAAARQLSPAAVAAALAHLAVACTAARPGKAP